MSDGDWRLAVDIGGTFTDVAARRRHGDRGGRQDAHHSERPARRVSTGVGQLLAKAGCARRHHRADRARDHPHHQRADRGQDRPGRARHHRRLRRHLLIRDEHRYDMYDLQIEFPRRRSPGAHLRDRPSARRRPGRRRAPSSPRLDALGRTGCAAEVESVAICLLNAYATPPTSGRRRATSAASSASRCASRARCRRRSASTRG
jgi:N-methylhydantoinase A